MPAGLPADVRLEARIEQGEAGGGVDLRLVPVSLPALASSVSCDAGDDACLDRWFATLDVPWSLAVGSGNGLPAESVFPTPGSLGIPLPRAIAAARLDAEVLPAGRERNTALMAMASALIGVGAYREALDQSLERDLWADGVPGPVSRGTAGFLAGMCHRALGEEAAARAGFTRAASDPAATLWEKNLPVAPLARLMLTTP